MEVKQIYSLVNDTTKEILGSEALLAEDLSNIVDIGTEVFNKDAVDGYVKSLVNRIGKVIFVNRVYSGVAPSVMMDSWEYGSVLEKIQSDIPEAVENDSWSLENGKEYSQDVFHAPTVSAKFFNKKITFEIDLSFTELQIKQSFANANELNGFLSMLYNSVDKSLTIKMDSLIMRTINNMIAETINADTTGIKAVNLLSGYNKETGNSLTAEKALKNAEFIRYASMIINLYTSRLSRISKLFNVGGKERFTSADMLHTIMLSDFKASADSYLQSNTFHNELTALPNAKTVPYWQGTGVGYEFNSVSSIDVKIDSKTEVKKSGILAVMFDRDSLGVTNLDRRVTTNYNAKAEFYSNYYKFDAGYFNDLNENFIVFYVENPSA